MGLFQNSQIRAAAQEMDALVGAPVIFWDTEFNRSQDPLPNLVCASLYCSRPLAGLSELEPWETWLHNDDTAKNNLTDIFEEARRAGAVLVAYASTAESRCLQALGHDPHQFPQVDLFAEWRQLTHNNHACEYGTYYTKSGFKRFSVPPSYEKRRNVGKDNNKVGLGLVDCVAQMFEVRIDSQRKQAMRDLILENRPEYTPEERREIMAYCSEDIEPLPMLWQKQTAALNTASGLPVPDIIRIQQRRGHFSASVAKMETVGFPLDLPKVHALRHNYESAQNEIIEDLQKVYPFFERQKDRAADLVGRWVDKYANFERFLKERDLFDQWPRTVDKETGKHTDTLSREDKILGDYDGIPEIKAYRLAKKHIKQLAWFKEPDKKKLEKDGDFFDSVGCDGRLRTFLGAFGTQTGRNAPKASRFVLAMSSWLRCLIRPPEGFGIIGIDYASQEFAIAAVMSGDPDMIAAYRSGDPYLYFAQKAGAVPWGVNTSWVKSPHKALQAVADRLGLDISHGVPKEAQDQILALDPSAWVEYQNYSAYAEQRGLFKSTTLGLQYGMGAAKLAVKLAADMGRPFTEDEARRLLELHKKTYPVYWKWLEKQGREYERYGSLILWDGWALLGDNDNTLSVRNFPVQGTGATIMREAVRLAHARGLDILAPLHDAIYCQTVLDRAEETTRELSDCMLQAVRNVIGDSLEIRLDIDLHTPQEVWVEGKGWKHYKQLKKYLEPLETPQDLVGRLRSTIYAEATP